MGALAVAAPALAKSGDSPKQNLFGVIGSEASLGGGASNYFAGEDTYSPYSPYAAHTNSDDGSYMLKVKIDILKDVQTKIKTIPAFVEKKQWSEVQSVLTNKVRRVYSCKGVEFHRCARPWCIYPTSKVHKGAVSR